MSVTLPLRLNRKTIEKDELQALFDALATGVVTPDDVEKMTLQYRHLKQVPKFHLRAVSDPLELSPIPSTGWYPMAQWVHHASTVPNADNYDESGKPCVELIGRLHLVGCGIPPQPTQACLGVSADGATWTSLPATVRPIGFGKGVAIPFYDSPNQPHYLYGGTGYRPVNYPYDGQILLNAMLGGADGLADPTAYSYFTIMLDGELSDTCQGFASMTLNARDNGQ